MQQQKRRVAGRGRGRQGSQRDLAGSAGWAWPARLLSTAVTGWVGQLGRFGSNVWDISIN